MITAVRHGSTSSNDGNEKLRGWLPLPLSQKGKEEALNSAEKLKNSNLNFNDFHTSPLKRAVQTSDIIKNEVGIDPKKTDHLKDWDIGNLVGKPVKDNLDTIFHYLENPNDKIPGGESYNDFYKRVFPLLENLAKSDDNHLVVTHNRVMTLLKALSDGNGKARISDLKKKGPVEPGGIMMIHPDWSHTIVYRG